MAGLNKERRNPMLLKTDYQDDILDLTQNANRKFNEVVNQDGSKSFEDVTEYEQEGTPFGANDVNAITKALTDKTHGVSFQFGIDGNGDYGYIKDGEETVTPFRNRHTETITPNSRATVDMGLYHKKRYVDLSAVPNVNGLTYTFPVNDTGATKDLGASNSYRYINAQNVYNKGVTDGRSGYMPIPTATKSITANGNNQDVLNYAKVNVNVANTFLSAFSRVAASIHSRGYGQTHTETYTANESGEYLVIALATQYDYDIDLTVDISSTGTYLGGTYTRYTEDYETYCYRVAIYRLSAGQTITTTLGPVANGGDYRSRMIFKIK